MKRLNIDVEEDLYKRMYARIQELSEGSTYGKATCFVTFAVERVLTELDGNPEVAEQLREALKQPVRRG